MSDDIFKCIFLKENLVFNLFNLLKLVTWGLIEDNSVLVHVMEHHLTGNQPLYKTKVTQFTIGF